MPSATRPQRPARWLRRGLRDLLDLQQRRLVAHAVALDAREPGVDHVADAGHGERRLGDIGREHDAPARATARTRAAARRPTAARRAAGSRRRARTAGARGRGAAGRRSRGSRARRAGTRGCRPGPRATGPRRRRRSPPRAPPRRRPPRRRVAAAAGSGPRPDTCGPTPRSPARARSPLPKCRAKRSASSVADVTITLRSGRRGSSCFR